MNMDGWSLEVTAIYWYFFKAVSNIELISCCKLLSLPRAVTRSPDIAGAEVLQKSSQDLVLQS